MCCRRYRWLSFAASPQADKADKVPGSHGAHGGSSHADLIGDPAAIEELARAFEQHEVMPLMLGHFKNVAFEVRAWMAVLVCGATV